MAKLVVQAIQQALQRRQPGQELQHHSDKGCQYTSGTVNWFDNAPVESVFHPLKTEYVYFERYESREQAKLSIFEYIEIFYDDKRRHSTLGYVSPTEFKQRHYQQTLCS